MDDKSRPKVAWSWSCNPVKILVIQSHPWNGKIVKCEKSEVVTFCTQVVYINFHPSDDKLQ